MQSGDTGGGQSSESRCPFGLGRQRMCRVLDWGSCLNVGEQQSAMLLHPWADFTSTSRNSFRQQMAACEASVQICINDSS